MGFLRARQRAVQQSAGVAVDSSDNVYVADAGSNRGAEIRFQRELSDPMGVFGTCQWDVQRPWALAVDGAGNVYVADTGNNRVQKFVP